MERKTVKLQGFNVDTFDFNSAVDYAKTNGGQIVTINPEMISCAKKNKHLAEIINNAELVVPDGIGVEIGLKILGHKVRRIAGIELGRRLVDEFAKAGKRIAMVGAKPEIIQKASENLKNEVQNLNLVYIQDGYFKDDERVLNELRNSAPDLVLVALGSPKQEEFISKAKTLLPQALMIGLGGSFDVWSGVIERAPEFYQKAGLEWLYRTVKEPKRFKRIFPTLPLFMLSVLKEKLGA